MTLRYGIIGYPVAHSRSPAMHNAAFRAIGLDARYERFEVEPHRLAKELARLRELPLHGFNLTVPHKTTILPLLDEIEDRALAIGAVNTVVVENGRLVGTNTDAPGLIRSIDDARVTLAGHHVTVLGAGGAARAAVAALNEAGARVTVAARRLEPAQQLVADFGGAATEISEVAEAFTKSSLLVQATSATLGNRDPGFADRLPMASLPPGATVLDIVYEPLETSILRVARERGLRTIDGLGMLLHQGALAFERWTGQPAPLDVMRPALTL